MCKIYTFNDEVKFTDKVKKAVMDKAEKAVDIWKKNPELVITALSVGATLITYTGKHARQHKQQVLHDRYCYDRSAGHYWKLRRKLRADEWLTVDHRLNKGERLGDILDSMKVLK